MSKSKQQWTEKYEELKDSFGPMVRSAFSGLLMRREMAEPHHPFSRNRDGLLAFLWLSKAEHKHLHDFGSQSYALGWLQPEHYGRPSNPHHPRPWKETYESHFPDRFKRQSTTN